MVNIIEFAKNDRWMVDVGFGGDCPIAPLPLHELNADRPDPGQRNFGSQFARLAPHDQVRPSGRKSRLWVYQTLDGHESSWQNQYCFPELEFFPNDYESMSYFTSTSPESFLTRTLLAVSFQKPYNRIEGKLILRDAEVRRQKIEGGQVKGNRHSLKTEAERVDLLEQDFGIHLTPEEKESIQGKPSELKS